MSEAWENAPRHAIESGFVDPYFDGLDPSTPLFLTARAMAVDLAAVCFEGKLDPFDPKFRAQALDYLGGDSPEVPIDDRIRYIRARLVFGHGPKLADIVTNVCETAYVAPALPEPQGLLEVQDNG
jgi:hypothetical protein